MESAVTPGTLPVCAAAVDVRSPTPLRPSTVASVRARANHRFRSPTRHPPSGAPEDTGARDSPKIAHATFFVQRLAAVRPLTSPDRAVALAQEPLVELAGVEAGKLALEVDRPRPLVGADTGAAPVEQLCFELCTRVPPVDRLHDRLHLLAE